MNKHFTQKGFTLLETLVAVLLISLSIVAFLGNTTTSIRGTQQAVLSLSAQALAQEGVELVFAIRNSNFLATPALAWNTGISDQEQCIGGCTIDPYPTLTTISVTPCAARSCSLLYTDQAGIFTHSAVGDVTPFSRIVYINPNDATGGIVVRSVVSWPDGATMRSATVTSFLMNWFQAPPSQTGPTTTNPTGIIL
jgi:prepilin-type N-terminal cleavage/methylation domain-containing protein